MRYMRGEGFGLLLPLLPLLLLLLCGTTTCTDQGWANCDMPNPSTTSIMNDCTGYTPCRGDVESPCCAECKHVSEGTWTLPSNIGELTNLERIDLTGKDLSGASCASQQTANMG